MEDVHARKSANIEIIMKLPHWQPTPGGLSKGRIAANNRLGQKKRQGKQLGSPTRGSIGIASDKKEREGP